MEIIVAKSAGFCFGVKRAVDMAFDNKDKTNIFTYGPIIHNEVVTGKLADEGIYVLDDMNEVENNNVQHLIIRSHGVGPEIYNVSNEKGIKIIDATCPYVKKIHNYVKKYHDNGYSIIIAGNKVHPEIIGINGWANNTCIIVKNVEELKQISLNDDKYLLVAQTTYKRELVEQIKEYLKSKNINFEYINTICSATRERQDEVVELAKVVDCMLVLGSSSSANTAKLKEISAEHCDNTHCINSYKEIDKAWLKGVNKVGITAGASTPQEVIDEVVKYIK